MPEPIATGISTLAGLFEKLIKSARDRNDAELVGRIQNAVFVMQSENLDLKEKNFKLEREILALQSRISEMEKKALEPQDEVRALDGFEFRKSVKTGGQWTAYCPVCHCLAHIPLFEIGVQCADPKCGWNSKRNWDEVDAVIKRLQ